MNNGQSAVIKEYRKATDIDVEFEDGTIVTHRSYNTFLNGSIRNPNKISVLICLNNNLHLSHQVFPAA
jgi:hypothetical protein